jgi:hypothetical protein
METIDHKKILHEDEKLVWLGNPIAGISRGRTICQYAISSLVLLISVLYILVPSEYILENDTLLPEIIINLIFIVLSLIAILCIIEPIIEKKMYKSTTFIVTDRRIISIVKNKIRETKITKQLTIKIWNGENNTKVIGFDTNNWFAKMNYHPVLDYLFRNFYTNPHYLYGIDPCVCREICRLITTHH